MTRLTGLQNERLVPDPVQKLPRSEGIARLSEGFFRFFFRDRPFFGSSGDCFRVMDGLEGESGRLAVGFHASEAGFGRLVEEHGRGLMEPFVAPTRVDAP